MARRIRRDRKKEAFWRRVVRGRAASGLSVRAWCARHAVRESAFYWWRAELARRDAAAATFRPVRIVESSAASEEVRADSSAAAPAGRIEIVLAGERRVCVVGPVDGRALRDVLSALGEGVSDRAEAVGVAVARGNGRVAEAARC